MIGCFAAGALLLVGILARYLHSRMTLASWNVPYGQGNSSGTNGTRSGTTATWHGTSGTNPRPVLPRRNIYDRWLVLRFSVAFAALRYLINTLLPLLSPHKPLNN